LRALASPGTVLACHAVIPARFPAITCAVLPVAGPDIDLPVVQARCCQVQQNGR
jgi:hypothetical protein